MPKYNMIVDAGPCGRLWGVVAVWLLLVMVSATAFAQEGTVARNQAQSAVVISRVGGETVRFVAESEFRELVVGQVLVDGDVVRTGPTGAVALLFVDRTAMRLHPNTELAINQVSDTQASLELTSGKVWARTPRETSRPVTVQTPSAAAAIRGTDWTLSVDTSDVTSVFVYDGQVDLSNAQGSVSAVAGAGVSASRGQAPRSVQVLNLTERQQMLFSVTAGAAANAIIQFEGAIAGQGAAPAAYLEGIALLRAGQFNEAATQLERAAPSFDPRRAAAARWVAAFARAEAGAPIGNPASGGTDVDVFARAYLSAYRGDLAATAAQLAPLQTSPVALADAVRMAVYLDRFDEAQQLLRQLQALAPATAQALSAEAFVLSIVEGNPSNAVPLYRRAVALDPENPTLLSQLAMAEHTVGHPIEAEAALRKALTLAPGDADILANLVVVLLDQSRVAEAQRVADQLSDAAPGAYTALMARARVDTSLTDIARAEESSLRALAAQPGAAENSILLAIAAHRAGDDLRAQQELDAAQRLDPNNPNVPAIRGAIALDYYRADEAIDSALEAERLFRQSLTAERLSANRKSGSILTSAFLNIGLTDWARDVADRSHDPLSASSLFNEAVTPRPNLVTEAALYDSSDSHVLGSEIQAYLLDPLGGFQRSRFNDLVTRPFLDGELSFSDYSGGNATSTNTFELTGFTTAPIPMGFSLERKESRSETSLPEDDFGRPDVIVPDGVLEFNIQKKIEERDARLGIQVSPRFSFVAFYKSKSNRERRALDLPGPLIVPTENEFRFDFAVQQLSDFGPTINPEMRVDKISFEPLIIVGDELESNFGIGLSYRLKERSIISFLSTTRRVERDIVQSEVGNYFGTRLRENVSFVDKNIGDLLAIGFRSDDANGIWFAGYERYKERYRFKQFESFDFVDFPDHFDEEIVAQIGFDPSAPDLISENRFDSRGSKYYLQRRQRLGGPLDIEAELGVSYISTRETRDFFSLTGDGNGAGFYYRFGVSATPLPGHRIRLARIQDRYVSGLSLAPSTVLGLYPVAVRQEIGGTTTSDIFRYDGTFGRRFHLSLEHQSLSYTRGNFGSDISGFVFSEANFKRTELRTDAWFGRGVGAFASMVWLGNDVPGREGLQLPGVPKREASVGASWVHPSRFRASAQARYTGARPSFELDNTTLDPVWTVDASASWESRNKHLQISASVINIFDQVVQYSRLENRQGRSFSLTAALRF